MPDVATCKVSLKVPNAIDVGRVDVEFEVREGNTLIGTLSISQGGIDWRAAGKRSAQSATWTRFAELMMTTADTPSGPAAKNAVPGKVAAPAPRRRPSASKAKPAARPARTPARRGQPPVASGATQSSPPSGSAIRAWALEQGITVNARGALSREVRDAYRAAHL